MPISDDFAPCPQCDHEWIIFDEDRPSDQTRARCEKCGLDRGTIADLYVGYAREFLPDVTEALKRHRIRKGGGGKVN